MKPFTSSSTLLGVALAVQFASGTPGAYAGNLPPQQFPTITITIEDGSATAPSWSHTTVADDYQPLTDGSVGYALTSPSAFDILDDRAHVQINGLLFDPDPFVLNNILVTNTTATPQIFSAFVGFPTTFAAPNLISGNVQTGVIDGGFDGATVAAVSPTALYQAQIDFATVATLQDVPFSLTAPPGGSNSASASFGPTVSGVPVSSNIGIQLRFSVTPGDTVSILSRFDVVAVPEPSSAAMLLLPAGLLLLRTRRAGSDRNLRAA